MIGHLGQVPIMGLSLGGAMDLTDLDRALIAQLQVDGRAPYADLARTLRVPQKRIAQRIRELREADAIRITTLADPAVYGYTRLAMVGLKVVGRAPSEVAEELILLESVDYVIISAGRYDIFVEIFCRDFAELRNEIEVRVRGIEGVHTMDIFPYMRLHHAEPAPFVPPGTPAMTQSHGEQIDDVDQSIVAALSEDGRLPLQTVGDRIGVSEANVRRRLKRMRDAGIARIVAITNPFNLGFEEIAKLAIVLAPGARASDVATRLAAIDEVSYVAVCAGRFDILTEALCTDAAALERVLDEEVRPLEGVARVEASIYLGLLMKSVGPRVSQADVSSAAS